MGSGTIMEKLTRYPKYKPTGVEWIGEIPEHWDIAIVGRLNNLGRGRVISNLEIGTNQGEYPVYSSQTENDGIMGYLNTYDFEGKYVTWTTDGANAGTVFYREGKFNCTNVCGTMQPKNWDQIDLRYLPYYLNLGTRFSVRLDINPKLMNNMMAKIPLILPPKPEQTAIANFLDEKTSQIDKLIANKQQLIQLLKEERTAIINQAVTRGINPNVKLKPSGIDWLGDIPEHWEVKKLKYVLRIKSGDGIKSEEIEFEGTYPVYGGNGIMGYTENYNYDGLDIIIGRVGAKCGNVRLVDGKKWISDNALVVDLFKGYNYKFISILLEAINLNSLANQNAQPLITGTLVRDKILAVSINLEEQLQIVQYIENETKKLDGTIYRIEEEIVLLQEYRTALISEVVTGKIKIV